MISHRGNSKNSLDVVGTRGVVSSRSLGVGAIALALLATPAACGGSTVQPGGAGGNSFGDSGAAAVVDSGTAIEQDAGTVIVADSGAAVDAAPEASHGAPSSTYPAFAIDVPQVVDNGGPTLTAPVVVTVTWSTDTNAATYNALGDSIGASTYWSDINSEYAVGAAVSGTANHVSITTAPPASYADSDLDTLVETNAGTAWPAYTAQTIYAIYLPSGTTLTSNGQDLCQEGVLGYHTESQNKNYVYAIIPNCAGFKLADIEVSASHELNEAATDPHPGTDTAYMGFDANHLAMEFFNQFQDELGDACEMLPWALSDTTDFTPYTVQRQWSNKSAAAGSQWCLPKVDQAFCNTTFLPQTNLDTISVNLNTLSPGAGTVQSKGFKMALNETRTFPIGMFSDMATTAPFTVDVPDFSGPIAQDQNGNNINNGTATVTLDKTTGVNGEIINVTVTPTAFSSLGVVYFNIRSVPASGSVHGELPVLISQN
jgi:hypothetical protein